MGFSFVFSDFGTGGTTLVGDHLCLLEEVLLFTCPDINTLFLIYYVSWNYLLHIFMLVEDQFIFLHVLL